MHALKIFFFFRILLRLLLATHIQCFDIFGQVYGVVWFKCMAYFGQMWFLGGAYIEAYILTRGYIG